MIYSILPAGVVLLCAATVASATTTCSLGNPCPEDLPCCDEYGECGVGSFCLGGCDPRMSYSLDACVPEPVCRSQTYKMDSMDRLVSVEDYLGNASAADWVYSGTPLVDDDSAILLTMPANSVGTVLSSTTYMWYGNVKAKMKTSRGAGVVTAFILFSDVQDEIDYEWVGVDLHTAQTNFYFQGVLNYDNSANITNLTDTYTDYHEYEIQWTPDSITWLADGVVGRVQQKSDTWNASSNQWSFPQTPARVQLSIWPGGASDEAQGTIDWAGGAINWSSTDIQEYGYDFAMVSEVTVECYNATSPPGTNTGVSYYYDSTVGTNNTVVNGDNSTILASFEDTGLDMDANASASTSGSTAVPTSSTGSTGVVPGSDGSSDSGSGGGSGTSTGDDCASTGFVQSCGSSSGSSSKNDGIRAVERTVGASAFAVVIAIAGMLFL